MLKVTMTYLISSLANQNRAISSCWSRFLCWTRGLEGGKIKKSFRSSFLLKMVLVKDEEESILMDDRKKEVEIEF